MLRKGESTVDYGGDQTTLNNIIDYQIVDCTNTNKYILKPICFFNNI